MADTKISALPASTTPLTGAETVPLVQGGVTKKATVANLSFGPAARAHRTATQSIASLTATKIDFNAENFDTTGNFASGRFTPTVAGYYQVNAALRFNSIYGFMRVMIYLNGSLYSTGTDNTAVGSGNVSDIVPCNGSTDYIEVWVLTNTPTDIAAGSENTWMSAALIKAS